MYPDSIKKLIESFKYLPGIGEKTAERLAFSVLEMSDEKSSFFSDSIREVKTKIKKCDICNNFCENDLCQICSNNLRNNQILCVVEDVKSLYVFEKTGVFNGVYHVLDGLISPLDGIDPEDIGLEKLINRINNSNFNEIILAFKTSIEGETTSLYIKRVIGDLNIKISRIASGIPIGADMEYIDAMTLERALLDRKNIE